jgi:hypothetical protein
LFVAYAPGRYVIDKARAGTRYVMLLVRTLADPRRTNDMAVAHRLQDAIIVEQPRAGMFEVPDWDSASREAVCEEIVALSRQQHIDSSRMFGAKGGVESLAYLIVCGDRLGRPAALGGGLRERLCNHPVRRLQPGHRQLPVDHARLELYRPPLPAARRGAERRLELSQTTAGRVIPHLHCCAAGVRFGVKPRDRAASPLMTAGLERGRSGGAKLLLGSVHDNIRRRTLR